MVKNHVISTKYLNTHHTYQNRAAVHFEHVDPNPQKEENIMTNTALFETPEGTYGTLLTKDSQGNYVLEMKGGGGVQAFDPKKLTEVMPYTIQIEWNSGKSEHFEVPKDKLKKGDLLVHGTRIGIVAHLDSKCKSAGPLTDARVVPTQKL